MIHLKRILWPTDFSETSKVAGVYACTLAEQFGAELHLLHVVEDVLTLIPEAGMVFPPPSEYQPKVRASAEKALSNLPDASWGQANVVVRHVRNGHPFLEIVRYAKEAEIDMIVVGTHGRTGLVHVLLGSVAEKVVRKAPCPVLTVRPDTHQFVMP
jgi:nucleotide-binding universal stress UspA family protein